jgi:Putative peptidoglycan binding domain
MSETLALGDEGKRVEYLQTVIGLPVDGEFGPLTETQVKAFQAACSMSPTGVVDSKTWVEVDNFQRRKGSEALTSVEQAQIVDLVYTSPLRTFSWKDRGVAPIGYLNGMAMAFAVAAKRWFVKDELALELAKASGHADDDALAYYEAEFKKLGMSNKTDSIDTLRHLFVLMIGLGMRESSGCYYEGRDQSADNVASDTCEAGLFQTSWNIASCDDDLMDDLMQEYWDKPTGFLPVFGNSLTPDCDGLEHYGSGEGARYQFMAKYTPLFAVLTTALGLRKRRAHWGPIGRREVQLSTDADMLLSVVQRIAQQPDSGAPPLPTKSTVDIRTSGNTIVTVNGQVVSK